MTGGGADIITVGGIAAGPSSLRWVAGVHLFCALFHGASPPSPAARGALLCCSDCLARYSPLDLRGRCVAVPFQSLTDQRVTGEAVDVLTHSRATPPGRLLVIGEHTHASKETSTGLGHHHVVHAAVVVACHRGVCFLLWSQVHSVPSQLVRFDIARSLDSPVVVWCPTPYTKRLFCGQDSVQDVFQLVCVCVRCPVSNVP